MSKGDIVLIPFTTVEKNLVIKSLWQLHEDDQQALKFFSANNESNKLEEYFQVKKCVL